ncbi:unnamed protein product [Cochlearia groenlandica]
MDLVKETHRRANDTYVDPIIEELVKVVEEEASQHQDSSDTTFSTSASPRELINQLYMEVKPKYGHAYGVGSARTQFYHPFVHLPSSTQHDFQNELNDIKNQMGILSGKIDLIMEKLLGGSSSQKTSQPDDFDTSQLHNLGFDYILEP